MDVWHNPLMSGLNALWRCSARLHSTGENLYWAVNSVVKWKPDAHRMKRHKFHSRSRGGKTKVLSNLCTHPLLLAKTNAPRTHPPHGSIYIIQWGFFTIFASQRLNHCYNPLKRNIRLVSFSLLRFSWIRKESWWPFNLDSAELTCIKLKVWLDNCMKARGLPTETN